MTHGKPTVSQWKIVGGWQFLYVNRTHALVEGVTKIIDSLLVTATDAKKCITIFSENLQGRICVWKSSSVSVTDFFTIPAMELCNYACNYYYLPKLHI